MADHMEEDQCEHHFASMCVPYALNGNYFEIGAGPCFIRSLVPTLPELPSTHSSKCIMSGSEVQRTAEWRFQVNDRRVQDTTTPVELYPRGDHRQQTAKHAKVDLCGARAKRS